MDNSQSLNINVYNLSAKSRDFDIHYSKDIENKTDLNRTVKKFAREVKKLVTADESASLKISIKADGTTRAVIRLNSKDVDLTDLEETPKLHKATSKLMQTVLEINLSSLPTKNPFDSKITPITRSLHQTIPTKQSTLNQKISQLFEKIHTYFFINPLIRKNMRHALFQIDRSPENLKKIYIDHTQTYEEIKANLRKIPRGIFEKYSDEKIDFLINELFIDEISKSLIKTKNPPLSEQDIRELDIHRTLIFLASNPMSQQTYDDLLKLSPLDIPLEKLAAIPLTPNNEQALARIWQGVIGNLFAKGALHHLAPSNDLSGQITQMKYAERYLMALKFMPEFIQRDLITFMNDLNKLQPIKTIQYHVIQNSIQFYSDSLKELAKKKKYYEIQIQPAILEILKNKNWNANNLSNYLAGKWKSNQEIETLATRIYDEMNKRAKKHFTIEEIKSFIYQEFENKAVHDFHLNTFQLTALRNSRAVFEKQKSTIDDLLSNYATEKSKIIKDTKKSTKQTNSDVQTLKKEMLDEYENLIETSVSIDALIAKQDTPMARDLHLFMYEKALLKLLTPVLHSKASIEISIEKKLEPYLVAKNKLQALPEETFPKKLLENVIEKIENDLPTEIQKQIEQVSISYYENWLSSDEIVDQIEAHQLSTSFLSSRQYVDLMHLTNIIGKYNKDNHLTPSEKTHLASILDQFQKDSSIMKTLNLLLDESNKKDDVVDFLDYIPKFLQNILGKFLKTEKMKTYLPAGISEASLEFLKTYLGKTKKIDQEIQNTIQKRNELIFKFTTGKSIKSKERLTLQEMGRLSRLDRMNLFFTQLEKLGLGDFNPKIKELKKASDESKAILEIIHKLSQADINSHYQEGDLLAYVGNKKKEWTGTPPSIEERLTMFATNGLTHGAKIHIKDGQVHLSHIYAEFEQDELELYQICISNVWELDIAPLVHPLLHPILKDILGENWQQEMNRLYREIEHELHSKGEDKFGDIENDTERRIKAGLANSPILFNLLGQNIKGHERKYERSFETLHEKFFDDESIEEEQICSEFASKVTLVCMMELNKRLSAMIEEKVGNSSKNILDVLHNNKINVPDSIIEYLKDIRYAGKNSKNTKNAEKQLRAILKQQGFSTKEIELKIRLGNREILQLPYSRKERLKGIHPGRMVSLLVNKKCARLKPPPKTLSALIQL